MSLHFLIGVEGGFDMCDEQCEYEEEVKMVILPEFLEIQRDGLLGLPEMVRDRVGNLRCVWGGGIYLCTFYYSEWGVEALLCCILLCCPTSS